LSGPGWLNIGASNGTIFGVPSSSDLGSNSFTIQVTDGKGGSDDHTFTVDVETDSDGDDEEDSDYLLWLIIIIIVILLIIFLIFLMRRKKEEE
jgi:LPXTG-motif cell wall-anchored protein